MCYGKFVQLDARTFFLITPHRELSNKEFNSNDTKGPKSVSLFVAKLSELAPRIVIKQMTSVAKFMDSDVSPREFMKPYRKLIF